MNINVIEPFLPPREEFDKYLDGIWARRYLTNNGPLVKDLEIQIGKYLGLNNFLYLSNGTIALQLALKALDIQGEVITTPFSFVATTSSIIWENCKPVFVDIDGASLNIDPSGIEQAITDKTSAILATHVFGNPCEVEELGRIAHRHGLKLIFDAAHCFGTKYKSQSVLNYGDISCISLHATKIFHTIEGGGIVASSEEIREKISRLRNFGFIGQYKFKEAGINGKNSEFHAAMGLCNLRHIDGILDKYKRLYYLYSDNLDPGKARRPVINAAADYNHAYNPIILNSEDSCLRVLKSLEENNIFARRYFYPSLDCLEYVSGQYMDISNRTAKKIICLPTSYTLDEDSVLKICGVINASAV